MMRQSSLGLTQFVLDRDTWYHNSNQTKDYRQMKKVQLKENVIEYIKFWLG